MKFPGVFALAAVAALAQPAGQKCSPAGCYWSGSRCVQELGGGGKCLLVTRQPEQRPTTLPRAPSTDTGSTTYPAGAG
jgi:hypothetical protein